MRSKFFNLSVFISCLVFGTLLTYLLTATANNSVERPTVASIARRVEITEQRLATDPINNNVVKEEDLPSDEQFEKWKFDSFKPVIKAWLDGVDLDDQYIQLERNDGWASSWEQQANTGLLDLDKDGQNELAIRTGCAPVGNCEFFILKKRGKSYRILLRTDMVQRYEVRHTKSHGLFDVETKSHGSVNSGGMIIYRFNGKEYVVKKCYEYVYESYETKSGLTLSRNKPTLTQETCSE